jgi:hypothetical protein
MRLSTYCWVGVGLYALLSVADLSLTFVLLEANPGAYEANPVAGVWLEQHGWTGLAVFKAGMVGVFVGSVCLLARRRPPVGAGVVTLGCAILMSVNFYSGGLIRQTVRAHESAQVETNREAKCSTPNGVVSVTVTSADVR